MGFDYKVVETDYNSHLFYNAVKGYEKMGEGSERCYRCFELRLDLEKKYKVKFLNSDFKKNNGFKCSVDLSKKYNLYRQNYCGCIFSQQEYIERMKNKNKLKDI